MGFSSDRIWACNLDSPAGQEVLAWLTRGAGPGRLAATPLGAAVTLLAVFVGATLTATSVGITARVTVGMKVRPAMLNPFAEGSQLGLALLLTAAAIASKLAAGLAVYHPGDVVSITTTMSAEYRSSATTPAASPTPAKIRPTSPRGTMPSATGHRRNPRG